MTLQIILFPLIFLSVFTLIYTVHDKTSLILKSFCIGGGFFALSVLDILPSGFILLGGGLFAFAYFDFLKIPIKYAKLTLSFVISLSYLLSSQKIDSGLFVLILLLPEFFDLIMFTFDKYMKKNPLFIFNNFEEKAKKNSFMALNICMICFSVASLGADNISAILIVCVLLNSYFYNKIKKNARNDKKRL